MNGETDRETDGQSNGRTETRTDDRRTNRETDRWQTNGQRDGQTERRTARWQSDGDGQRDGRTEIRTNRDGWTLLATKHSLKFSSYCVKHYTALQAEDRETGQRAERRGRGQRYGGRGELIDRRLSSVIRKGALLNKSSRLVAAVIWPIHSSCSLQLCSLMWTEVSI